MKILTAAQMERVDRLTSENGLPGLLLMENAGQALYRALRGYFDEPESLDCVIVCGAGNNGGDGFVLARQLLQRGGWPTVVLAGDSSRVQGDARVNLEALRSWKQPIVEIRDAEQWQAVASHVAEAELVVDALLGTGLNKPLSGLFAMIVGDLSDASGFVLSVDLPSGMVADSTEAAPLTVRADATVTFTTPKIAHILNADLEAMGDLHVAPIGTPPALLADPDHCVTLLDSETVAASLPVRKASSHKGTYGHVAVIAGSVGKSGAAALTSRAALFAGSGLVTAVTSERAQPLVACAQLEVMTQGFPCDADGKPVPNTAAWILQRLEGCRAAALGPGLGTSEEVRSLIREIIGQRPWPLVLDADGLSACCGDLQCLDSAGRPPLILTPHPGEFGRLVERPVSEVLRDQLALTADFARHHNVWVVFKAFRTVIACPDGTHIVSPLGNPGMATAGMGDCLTGVLASHLGQSGELTADKVTAAVARGVYLHGLAADLAAEESSEPSLTASAVIERLGRAYRHLCSRQ